jgi:hypothetical protein
MTGLLPWICLVALLSLKFSGEEITHVQQVARALLPQCQPSSSTAAAAAAASS